MMVTFEPMILQWIFSSSVLEAKLSLLGTFSPLKPTFSTCHMMQLYDFKINWTIFLIESDIPPVEAAKISTAGAKTIEKAYIFSYEIIVEHYTNNLQKLTPPMATLKCSHA